MVFTVIRFVFLYILFKVSYTDILSCRNIIHDLKYMTNQEL